MRSTFILADGTWKCLARGLLGMGKPGEHEVNPSINSGASQAIQNEVLEVIKKRRSVRKFKPEQIQDFELNAILDAAIHAPSAMNQQRWHFTVIQDKATLQKMTDIARENILKSGNEFMVKRASSPEYSLFHNAPTAIVISGDSSARFVQLDCALAAQNILLAAESLNIGSCIMIAPDIVFKSPKGPDIAKEIGIPDGYEHVCTVVLGYPDEQPAMKPRRSDVINFVR